MRPQRPSSAFSKLVQTVVHVIGSALVFVAVAMGAAALVGVVHGEYRTARGIFLAALVTAAAGLAARKFVDRPETITVKQGFATVGLAWFVFSLFGALPYLFTGAITGLTDAVFETTSGFTTTGSSVVPDPTRLPLAIVFWRALTQWLGGMGVIVLAVAVLPLLGTGGAQLARAESPGPTLDRLTPRFSETAKRLWIVYMAMTAIQVVFLALGEMDLFHAVIHSFSTTATGGFGIQPDSVASFSPYTQWVIAAFMFAAGASFALHYRALTRPAEYARSSEFRLYALITAGAILIIAGGLLADMAPGEAIRHASFNAISVITTTGFTSSDFGVWRPALQIMIFGLMFVGAMAGSTAGGIKTYRIGVLAKTAYSDLRRLVHPKGVFVTRFGGRKVGEPVVEAVQNFFLFYIFLFMAGTFLVAFIDANLAESFDLITTASAVASALGNIGPGLGEVGPAASFAEVPALVKWVLSGLMIVGRLEIFPVLVLFTRDLWKR